MSDPQDRRCVIDLVPKRYGRVYPVGRLDYQTEGVLLMTNDGAFTQALLHPSSAIERVYIVKVSGHLDENDERLERIALGVRLSDGAVGRVTRVEVAKHTDKNTWIEIGLCEGRNREIRRICEAVNLSVQKLVRVSFAGLTLGELRRGQYRELSAGEVHDLREMARGNKIEK